MFIILTFVNVLSFVDNKWWSSIFIKLIKRKFVKDIINLIIIIIAPSKDKTLKRYQIITIVGIIEAPNEERLIKNSDKICN